MIVLRFNTNPSILLYARFTMHKAFEYTQFPPALQDMRGGKNRSYFPMV